MSTTVRTKERTFWSHKRLIIPAGMTIPVNVTGTVFVMTEATGAVKIAFDDGEEIPWNLGLKVRFTEGDWFDRVRVTNPSTTESVLVEFLCGRGDVDDQRLNIVRDRPTQIYFNTAPTVLKEWAGASIAAGAEVSFPGTAAVGSGYTWRKSILITNLDPASDLEILAPSGNRVGTVFFRQAWILETSADLKVKNESAAPINCRIAEVWFPET